MEITLKKLVLKNFKGLTGEYGLNPGKNSFLGRNGTGKTTLFDSVTWLLSGKDSLGSAKFDIKTIKDGSAVQKMDHGVFAEFEVDGKSLTLERVYSEKWTKTRGKMEREFEGHETKYSIDGKANTAKKHYDEKVNDVFGLDQYRIVSDPKYFPGLKWEDRRGIIFKISGEVDINKIIDSIDGLRGFLDDKTIEERKAIADERKRKINEELKTLPALIAENKEHISNASGGSINLETAEKKVLEKSEAVKLAKKKIDDFKAGENSGDIEKLQSLNQELREKTTAFENEKNQAQSEVNARNTRLKQIDEQYNEKSNLINRNTEQINQLKTDWKAANSQEFSEKGNTCNYCGEVIACGHCDETDDDGIKKFNQKKSDQLEAITNSGKSLVIINKDANKFIDELTAEKTELEKIKEPAILFLSSNLEIETLKKSIKELSETTETAEVPEEFNQAVIDAETELSEAQEAVAGIKATKNSTARVAELEKKLEKIRSEFEKIEQFLFLYDEYNKKFAKETEAQVNDLFEYVNFRMFNTQINGAIVPCCDIMNDELRPYDTAMSKGEQIRAGLDIIKTMSKHYQLKAPIFIDNAESLTMPFDMDCQTIELIASKDHKILTQV